MSTTLFIILVIAFFIALPFVIDHIYKKDFRDQITGKKPERKCPPDQKISYDKPHHNDSMTDEVLNDAMVQIKRDTKSMHL